MRRWVADHPGSGEPLAEGPEGEHAIRAEVARAGAIEAGRRVVCFSLEPLTAPIGRAKVDGSTGRVAARICRSDLPGAIHDAL
jgi:hypothetical protein